MGPTEEAAEDLVRPRTGLGLHMRWLCIGQSRARSELCSPTWRSQAQYKLLPLSELPDIDQLVLNSQEVFDLDRPRSYHHGAPPPEILRHASSRPPADQPAGDRRHDQRADAGVIEADKMLHTLPSLAYDQTRRRHPRRCAAGHCFLR
eukprot:gene8046-5793_t